MCYCAKNWKKSQYSYLEKSILELRETAMNSKIEKNLIIDIWKKEELCHTAMIKPGYIEQKRVQVISAIAFRDLLHIFLQLDSLGL